MDAEEARTIGRRLRQIRKARRKALVVVAGLAGMSKSKLDRIERGEMALDKLSDIVALADALEVAPGDLVRLPVPAPANGHTDSTVEAVGQALDAIEVEEPGGLVLPVAVLVEQVSRMVAQVRACRFAEVASDLPGLIANLHTTLDTDADHAELLELAVCLHVQVTGEWLRDAGAHTQLRRRVAFLARRLARERDEVASLAMAGYGVARVLLAGGAFRRCQAVLDSIALPPTTPDTARLVALLTKLRAKAAVLHGRVGDAVAPMDAAAELAERFGTSGDVDSHGLFYTPVDAAGDRIWLALEADEPDQAVNLAREIDPRHHPFPIARAYLWIQTGQGLSKLPGRGDDAVRALRTAERVFPTKVLRSQAVREVLGELLTRGLVRGAMGVELRGMAYRAGLLTNEPPSA
ncbi:MAG: helix-turn-helix domain-containing protein [Pseudonocardiaceae bacterium]